MAGAAGQAFRADGVPIVRINRGVTGKNNARSSPKFLLHLPSACSLLLFCPHLALHQFRWIVFGKDFRWLTECWAPALSRRRLYFACCLQALPAAQHKTASSSVATGSDPAQWPRGWFAVPVLHPAT